MPVSAKAVINGELQHVSASQIKLFGLCPRAWYLNKVVGIEREPTVAMVTGTLIHKYLQNRLENRVASFEYEAVCKEALSMVPKGGQAEVSLETSPPLFLDGLPVHGFIDYLYDNGEFVTVVDWKTTGDLRRAFTDAEARTAPQTLIYLRWALQRRKFAELKYIYIRTTGAPAVKLVSVAMSAGEVFAGFEALAVVVKRMRAVAKQQTANEVLCTCGKCIISNPMSLTYRQGDTLLVIPSPTSAATSLTTGSAGLTLVIDAVPLKGYNDVVFLDSLIAERMPGLCEKEQVNDLRLVPFGKGKGLLAASLRSNPPTGVIICRSGDLADVAIEALIPLATCIVRGVK